MQKDPCNPKWNIFKKFKKTLSFDGNPLNSRIQVVNTYRA